MEKQLELVARAYDRAVDLGRRGMGFEFPEHITNDPDYPLLLNAMEEGLDSDSGSEEIKDYSSPSANMSFIDLGCCLNLMFRGYDEWPSLYHGVDISSETMELLNEYVAKKNMKIGSLFCGSIHETPFDDNSFDIGACIGVLECFEKSFVEKALIEIHRIMKPGSRFVLDIPNNESPMRRIMNMLEEYRGCPVRFDMSPREFDVLLQSYFKADKVEILESVAMIRYFLRRKK